MFCGSTVIFINSKRYLEARVFHSEEALNFDKFEKKLLFVQQGAELGAFQKVGKLQGVSLRRAISGFLNKQKARNCRIITTARKIDREWHR